MAPPSEIDDSPEPSDGVPHTITLVVDHDAEGRRLDRYLVGALEVSREQVRRLLERGAVRREGRALSSADKGRPVRAGERLVVADFRRPADQRIPVEEDARLAVLDRGPGWLAVDKPAGWGVHPLREGERGTVLGALVAQHPEIQGVGEGGLRSGVIHRLDVDTSGALLVATGEESWKRLYSAFRQHRVAKRYLALVHGELRAARNLELWLRVARHRPARVVVARGPQSDARATRLSFRPLEALGGATLLEVRPETGFLHQIRASLAHLGHPVVGDAIYGEGGDATVAARHMLHAAELVFEEIHVECAAHPDFEAAREALRDA